MMTVATPTAGISLFLIAAEPQMDRSSLNSGLAQKATVGTGAIPNNFLNIINIPILVEIDIPNIVYMYIDIKIKIS